MKFTPKLFKEGKKFMWNRLWKSKAGRFHDPPANVSPFLAEQEIEVVDPNENSEENPLWNPLMKHWKSRPAKETSDFNGELAYLMTPKVRLLEGLKQACILAKAEQFDGLPPSVKQLVNVAEIPHQDCLVQRYIMQSQMWNPTKDKLPRRIDKENIAWKFTREYGIHKEKSAIILCQNLIRLCQSLAGDYPSLLTDRRLIPVPYIGTHYNFKDKLINIRGHAEWLMSSRIPLSPFAEESGVDDSVNSSLPDMSPISPTIDLQQTRDHTMQNQTAFKNPHSHRHPHTFFMIEKNYWHPSHRMAKCLMYCLGYTIAEARTRYGIKVKNLPEPICVQCVDMDQNTVGFIFFQLNTLNFSSQTGIKNMVWVDHNVMFEKMLPKPWRGEEFDVTHYSDYNPNVFQKFLAMFLNNLPDVDSVKQQRASTS